MLQIWMDQLPKDTGPCYSLQELKAWRQKARTNLLNITIAWLSHILDKHTTTQGSEPNILLEPGNAYFGNPIGPEERNSFLNQPNWICPICATLEQQAQNAEAHLEEIERREIQSWVTFPLI